MNRPTTKQCAGWIGCGECDTQFGCFDGREPCIRNTPTGGAHPREEAPTRNEQSGDKHTALPVSYEAPTEDEAGGVRDSNGAIIAIFWEPEIGRAIVAALNHAQPSAANGVGHTDHPQSEKRESEPVGSYESGWNEAIQRALLACEGEQSKYKYENNCAKAVRGALEYAMFEIRALKVPPHVQR